MNELFAKVLNVRRVALNGRFAAAKRINRRLDADAFGEHLLTCVAPLVDAVAAASDGDFATVVRLTESLYDVSLELAGRDLAGPGANQPWMSRLWRELLPSLAGVLVEEGTDVVAALSNAIHNLADEPGLDLETWFAAMRDGHGLCSSSAELLATGQVLAWRVGLAHYRESARAKWAELPEPLQRLTLSLPESVTIEEAAGRLESRWDSPASSAGDSSLEIVARVGGFRGFGGDFISPPGVRQVEGDLYVWDSRQCYALHADHFGATLKKFGASPPPGCSEESAFVLSEHGEVSGPKCRYQFDELRGASSWTSSKDTLAVALSHSHEVLLVASVKR